MLQQSRAEQREMWVGRRAGPRWRVEGGGGWSGW